MQVVKGLMAIGALLIALDATAQETCAELYGAYHAAPAGQKRARHTAAIDCYCQAYERAGAAGNPDALFLCARGRHALRMFELAARHYQVFLALDDPRRDADDVANARRWLPKALKGKTQDWEPPPVPVVRVTAAPAPKKTPPTRHALEVRCTPEGAEVFVGERAIGRCPTARVSLAPGSHQVIVRAPEHDPGRQQVNLVSDHAILVDAAPIEKSGSPVPWIVGGVGVAAVGLGGYFHAENHQHFDEAQALGDRGIESPALNAQILSDRKYALGAYIAGGVLVSAAISWLIWEAGQ